MAMYFGQLKLQRKKCGMTQEAVAEALGVSRQAVAKWEKGESMPDVESCVKMADLYGVSLDMLVRNLTEKMEQEGQKMFGCAKVNEKGQITLPVQIRESFSICPGDQVMVLADTEKGIALVPLKTMETQAKNAEE